MQTKFQIYQDKKREWRWRAKRKGRIVAESGEGYKRQAGCRKSLVHFLYSIADHAEQYGSPSAYAEMCASEACDVREV